MRTIIRGLFRGLGVGSGAVSGYAAESDNDGERRLYDAINRPLAEKRSLAEGLPEAFDRFRRSIPQQDDATFIALQVT